jgi:LacI family transcriptional regulator, galactose operon repressor
MSELRKTTYKDIARIADVSVATVARVANGNPRVNSKLRKQVLEAAHGLRIDLAQRSRKLRKRKVIAFLLCNREMLHPFHSHVLVGAEAASISYQYTMLFHCLHYPPAKPPSEIYLPSILDDSRQISGLILAGANFPNLLDLLSQRRVPFVVLGNNVVGEWENEKHDVVWFDDIRGAHELTQYLQALGHRDIWYIGNTHLPWYKRRYEGYRRAMAEAQFHTHLCEFDSADDSQVGYLATKSILAQKDPFTAIFAASDGAAQGACTALKEEGISVPDDVSVAGFNDTESARWYPPLTTVSVFADQIGRLMVELLQRRLNHPEMEPQSIVLPTRLIKRESCSYGPLRLGRSASISRQEDENPLEPV